MLKNTIYKTTPDGTFLLDSSGAKIIENYQRYIPESQTETYYACAYIISGIIIVLALEIYGQKTQKKYG